jgi:hypothetical protein
MHLMSSPLRTTENMSVRQVRVLLAGPTDSFTRSKFVGLFWHRAEASGEADGGVSGVQGAGSRHSGAIQCRSVCARSWNDFTVVVRDDEFDKVTRCARPSRVDSEAIHSIERFCDCRMDT